MASGEAQSSTGCGADKENYYIELQELSLEVTKCTDYFALF